MEKGVVRGTVLNTANYRQFSEGGAVVKEVASPALLGQVHPHEEMDVSVQFHLVKLNIQIIYS